MGGKLELWVAAEAPHWCRNPTTGMSRYALTTQVIDRFGVLYAVEPARIELLGRFARRVRLVPEQEWERRHGYTFPR